MWNVKANAVLVMIGATGTILKALRKYLSNIPGNTKTSHIGHCTHTTESTNVKVQNIFYSQNNITCKYRTATTLYTLDTGFISGI
jgi:hypothetical protein